MLWSQVLVPGTVVRVVVGPLQGRLGTIRYYGPVHFTPGNWVRLWFAVTWGHVCIVPACARVCLSVCRSVWN